MKLCMQIWKGVVVDPAPKADATPRTVSMTWTSTCETEVSHHDVGSKNVHLCSGWNILQNAVSVQELP